MSKFSMVKYRMMQWAFKWVCDEDGDVGLQMFGIVTFIKYKNDTIIHWGGEFRPAGKWQGYDQKMSDPPSVDFEYIMEPKGWGVTN